MIIRIKVGSTKGKQIWEDAIPILDTTYNIEPGQRMIYSNRESGLELEITANREETKE